MDSRAKVTAARRLVRNMWHELTHEPGNATILATLLAWLSERAGPAAGLPERRPVCFEIRCPVWTSSVPAPAQQCPAPSASSSSTLTQAVGGVAAP